MPHLPYWPLWLALAEDDVCFPLLAAEVVVVVVVCVGVVWAPAALVAEVVFVLIGVEVGVAIAAGAVTDGTRFVLPCWGGCVFLNDAAQHLYLG